jgi:hypothetical protein
MNGLHGYRTLTVADSAGKQIGTPVDLTRFKDPRKHTLQIPNPDRYGYLLEAQGLPSLRVTNDGGLSAWAGDADTLPPMSKAQSPAYCLTAGKLCNRTEVPRWDNLDLCGLAMHGWEGGYGAPDCWNCFRPWPTRTVTVNLTVSFG